jgi:hypothetical protein
MNTPTLKSLKAYIRIDGSGRDVPSSLIYRKNKPTVGKWKEINSYECCITPISTTTSTTTSIPIECIVFLAANNNIYIYDPIVNSSVEILSGNYFGIANTSTKLWTAVSSDEIQEFNLIFSPGPIATYNRTIYIGGTGQYGSFAISNTKLIIGSISISSTLSVYEVDITTNTGVKTYKGDTEAGYIILDFILTASGKLIVTGIANDLSASKVWQYDYATWILEMTINTTNQFTNGEKYATGVAEYDGNIYLFTRLDTCFSSSLSGVYLLNPNTPYNLTYVGNTGFGCTTGASSLLSCNTTKITPGIIPTTTTTTSTSTTTTTLAPTGFNTIYTHFESL